MYDGIGRAVQKKRLERHVYVYPSVNLLVKQERESLYIDRMQPVMLGFLVNRDLQ